ncbi:alpha-2-macroglobulin family protein [Telluria aromaticivorans]|uniref:Alpha-2-macroglobulin n=1 Tax=Telluria aromaticivorans TaxID=2725995 RepID=A0A7Y2NY44_9BURK|nr:MG2 domain-containing protein [Telluria aromaticivorans]NNG21688.1 alpha-2-macroglobulin [Telluria aromaticivorans]
MRVPKLSLVLLAMCLSALPAWAQTTVEAFHPTGQVKSVRQVTARFSAPMAAFGDPRAPMPFEVDCPAKGAGRWIDTATWSYDFERDLPGATACRFTLRADARDLAGQALAGERSFALNTGGPAVVRVQPREDDSGIDEHQVFLLALDAAATPASIERHAWCRAEGINEKIGVRLLAGEERERLLARHRHLKAPVVALQCRRTLPADSDISLVWGRGIAAPNGIATSQDQELAFHTRPEFRLLMRCERTNARAGCVPFRPVHLTFSAPVAVDHLRALVLEESSGKRHLPQFDDEAKSGFASSVTFTGPFAEQSTLQLRVPGELRDDAGRSLAVPRKRLSLRVDRQPPLVKFAAPFGIIEAKGDRMLPVTVRNVEPALALAVRSTSSGGSLRVEREADILAWLGKLNAYGSEPWNQSEQYGKALQESILGPKAAGSIERFALPRPQGRRAFEVIGIPLRKHGFYVVELSSPLLGKAINDKGRTAYVRSAALVTNMAAHLKRGAVSSLVWVTSLDKGRPVARAQVAVRDCAGKLLWSGVTGPDGIAHIRTGLARARCGDNLFVSARSGDDFTFTLSSWQQGIEPWRFRLAQGGLDDDSRLVATVFDRTLLRAGETVHMKHFLRRRTPAGIALVGTRERAPKRVQQEPGDEPPERVAVPAQAWLVHQGSGDKLALPLRWDAGGQAHGEWTIPPDSKLGSYQVMVGGQVAGEFRVEQFRVPTMKAILKPPAAPAVAPRAVTIDAQVNYLNGGPAGLAPVTLRTVLQPGDTGFDGFEGFIFGGGDVREGVEQLGQYGFGEGDREDDVEAEAGEDDAPAEAVRQGEAPRTQRLALDRAGAARITVPDLPQLDRPRSLLAELSWQDANGETLSASTRVPLWPAAVAVGIRTGESRTTEKLKFQVAVAKVDGRPAAGVEATVDFFRRDTTTHRRRLVGGFYAYESSSEIKRIEGACNGRTDARGLLLCEVGAPGEGNIILRARVLDADGRASVTRQEIWVAGKRDAWFDVSDNDRIDLLPAKPRFEPGENAVFQVRSPFREATVLVSVEREGILDTYVRRLSAKDPTVSIPVKASYAPNVYVSALVVRGRVAGVKPTALVDLGKPAYKLGIADVKVGWAAHELKVQVVPDRQVYKVRERAGVRVKVTRADGKPLPLGAEIALAAVDTGLLELMPNESWKLLEAMMRPRSQQVETSTAQMLVVGKRHFGRKSVPHGGGGGRGASRELFDTLLAWKGKVVLDANGEAEMPVQLNDSLTGFRIVAIASAGAGMFGTGSSDIRSTQDLMLLSGLPSLVREGDRLRAGFTVRNASATPQRITLSASMGADQDAARALPPQTISLEPGAAREIGWDVTVPQAKGLRWQVDAVAGIVRDSLRVTQAVAEAVPVRTWQATLLQVDGPKTMTVERPADALPGKGGVRTTFTPKLAGSLAGVRDYMAAYPYTCFEQRTSKSVALGDAAMWRAVAATLPAHLDGDGMLKYFPTMRQGDDALTAYVLSVTAEAGYAIPDDGRERMEGALVAFVEGRVTRGSGLRTGELAVRKLSALEALSRRQPVRQAWLQSFRIEPNSWPTSGVIDWYLILQRSPELENHAELLAQAHGILRARLNLQGTTMGFSTERSDDWWWMMASPDVNANRLLLAMLDDAGWQGDMGRLARGTLGRQQKGRWNTTLANAWGALAMQKFSAKFEATPVTGMSRVQLAGQDWRGAVPATVLQGWPQQAAPLAIRHEGTGKPWATVQSLAAVPLKAPVSSGYRITRTVTPVERKAAGSWTRGDVYRVRLELDAQADMSWVVVDDPIPASASILGTGLGGDSRIATAGEARRGWVLPDFEERTAGAFRAYYSWVPKGKWSIEYTVRLNNEGRFSLPPTRVEAMYNPEMFGESPNATVVVGP